MKLVRRIYSVILVIAVLVSLIPGVAIRSQAVECSEGIQNIVKRARQMTEIQWTPVKDITGWDGGVTYKAGTTYTGLPYGQPVDADYVPWETSLMGFLAAVNDPNSKMYTSNATNNKIAPYYSVDCSAFVSWAWGLSARQDTRSITNFATQISETSYENAQVGDCLNKAGSHVVLITDITYDTGGTINSIEISESTTDSAHSYCCKVTRYGDGGSYTLNQLVSKYFGGGYILYRCNTRDSVTYTHSCAVPLDGDTCEECGVGGYVTACTSYPCAVEVDIIEDCCPYTQPCNPTTASNVGYTSEKLANKPISKGEILIADALYENTEGNYWYRVTLSDGTKAYLYSTHTQKAGIIYPWVAGGSFPSSITGTTNLQGTVTTGGSRLDTVQAVVCKQGGTDNILESDLVTVNAATYPLKSSAVDKTTVFGDLANYGAGYYTLKIDTAFTTYYAADNELCSAGMCAYAATYDFYYSSTAHTCDKGTYVSQQTAHPHYSQYQCSTCGEIWIETNETNYSSSCTACNSAVSSDTQIVYDGIDVSHWQGTIDWDTVAPNIDFAIIRCGYGDDLANQDDSYWYENVDACTRLGIPFGVYLMSYAVTDEQAVSEAQHVLRLVEGYDPTLPIYLDLEDTKYILPNCSNADILRHAQIFCDILEDAGYTVGIYANYDWWTNYLTDSAYDQWSRWIARYASATGYDKEYDMWQYSSSGSIPGISGDVDLNYWYGPLPSAHEHSYIASITGQPTCTQSGVRTYICSCGDSYTESIAPTGHAYSSQQTQPTCTTGGYTTYTCENCGDTFRGDETDSLGHDYSGGSCTRCGVQDDTIIKGDLNDDGVITSADSVMLARYLADLLDLTDNQILAADINGDGVVTSADSVVLARYLAGLIDHF